jgi:hypothetical protein
MAAVGCLGAKALNLPVVSNSSSAAHARPSALHRSKCRQVSLHGLSDAGVYCGWTINSFYVKNPTVIGA